jgi:hypothetical protein
MMPVMYIFQTLVAVEILSIYIYLALKGTGNLRRKAFSTIISILILFSGIILDMRVIWDLGIDATYILAPILVMIGVALFYAFQSHRKTD